MRDGRRREMSRYQSGSGVNLNRSMPRGWLLMLNRRAEIGSGYCYSGWWFITSGSIATTTVVTFNFYWSSITNDGRQILNV